MIAATDCLTHLNSWPEAAAVIALIAASATVLVVLIWRLL